MYTSSVSIPSRVFLDRSTGRLVYRAEASTPGMWDGRWKEAHADLRRSLHFHETDLGVRGFVKRHLPSRQDRILEGGCGIGGHVYALRKRGLKALGLDWSPETLRRTLEVEPGLPLVAGDVTRLPFRDASFGLYLSFGVIEHFPDGYVAALKEAARVLRPGGRLVLTFPALSPLRRLKRALGRYPDDDPSAGGFYQYALDPAAVAADAEALGFRRLSGGFQGGLTGLASDLGRWRGLVDPLAESRTRSLAVRALKHALDLGLAPLSGNLGWLALENTGR